MTQRSTRDYLSRRAFIGGSDARVIMGDDEAALLRLWRENLSGNLIVQLGLVTENLNQPSASLVCRPYCRRPCRGSATSPW